jgi:hypothetical protein
VLAVLLVACRRFVPTLRSDGVDVVLGVFKALCILGGEWLQAGLLLCDMMGRGRALHACRTGLATQRRLIHHIAGVRCC